MKLDATWNRVQQGLVSPPAETYGGGYILRQAWNLHQTFEWSMIASLEQAAEYVLGLQQVSDWIGHQG